MDNKNQLTEEEILTIEAVLKTVALERLLTKKGLITSDELTAEMKTISGEIIGAMQKAFLKGKD